jgi:hypothetical protein
MQNDAILVVHMWRVEAESRMVYPVQAVGISGCCCIAVEQWKCPLIRSLEANATENSYSYLQTRWDCRCVLVNLC